ncbi:ABC transporter ATP-binding protein [Clostridium sp. E02]|uniref:ABC transporter ATP-binding protein n=1 Tax=Clostridium sp. E02 TaxID=2487134 RepID=UPI0013DE614C|nr:ABC transporter ATP-binding protein [Clostridium sp. E02]
MSKFLSSISNEYCNAAYMRLRLKIIAEMSGEFMRQPYNYLESTDFLDKSQKSDVAVKGCSPGLEAAVKSLTLMGGHFVTCLVSLIAFATFQPLLVPFIMAIVLSNRKLNEWKKKQEKELVESCVFTERKAEYFFDLMSDFRYGKEIRIFQFHNWIKDNFHALIETLIITKSRIIDKGVVIKLLVSCLSFIQIIIVYVATTVSVLSGKIDIGSYLTYIGLASVFATALNQLMGDTIEFKYHGMYVNDLMQFFDQMDNKDVGTYALADFDLSNWTIEFDHISFHYPNQTKDVISNLCLKIHKGDKIAITGLNGAGKTTMIKLLARLYEPTQGKILLNGVDIQTIKRKELYQLFAPMFQEVFMFAFSVKENITLRPKEEANERLIWEALKKVGLKEKIATLPKQLDTSCLNQLDLEGVQFSGGQQQRLVLARTLYKDREIFIFDEPTAALDALAEDMIYREFYKMTENKTAIFITHRLASTKFCDSIYVLNQGNVIQHGTHESLLQEEGEYQQLFELQAKNYREEGKCNA